MSVSRHPIALRLERIVGGDGRLLALVMGLPLLDGIFVALLLAGTVSSLLGALQVGLLIFGGSATVAVILADMDDTPANQAKIVLLVGVPLILFAGIQAAIAPTLATVLDIVVFERFAAIVIMAVAASTASATIGEYIPSPGIIIVLGLIASIEPAGFEIQLTGNPELIAYGVLAATVGVGFALVVALTSPYLRNHMDIDRFRFGSAVALGLLPLAILGLPFGHAPLAVLAVTALFAFDPNSGGIDRQTTDADGAHSKDSDTVGRSTTSGSDESRLPWL